MGEREYIPPPPWSLSMQSDCHRNKAIQARMQQMPYLRTHEPNRIRNTERRNKALTMPIAQTTKVVRDAVQIVLVWRHLHARVTGCTRQCRFLRVLAHVWWEWRWHVIGEIEALEREIHNCFDLVCERPLDREALQVDQ